MKIELNLKNHCIKTELKKLYEKRLSACIRKSTESDMLILETLKDILEKNDLVSLRGKHSLLAGGSDENSVYLILEGENERYIEIEDSIKIKLK